MQMICEVALSAYHELQRDAVVAAARRADS